MENPSGRSPAFISHGIRALGEVRRSVFERSDRWIIDGLLPEGALIVLAGEPKCGKSTLLANLAAQVAQGEPWLGRRTTQGKVLWLAYEESDREWAANFAHMGSEIDSTILHVMAPPSIDSQEGAAAIGQMIEDHEPVLVVIDPLAAATKDADFDHTGQGRAKLQQLKEIIGSRKCACIVVHHLSKGSAGGRAGRQRVSGSHQILAAASGDWILHLKKVASARTITLNITQRMVGELSLIIESPRSGEFRAVERLKARTPRPLSLAQRIEEHVKKHETQTQTQLTVELRVRQSSISKAANNLVEAVRLQKIDVDGNVAYRLS